MLSSKTAADAAASASNLHKLNKPNKLNKLFLILAAILACTPAVNASGAGADYAGFENTATYHLPALSIWAGLLLGGVMLLLALLLHFREPKPAKPQTWTFSDFLVLKLNPVPHHQPKSKD
ncbi:MAG: hypothetical protein LBK71_08220 [Verrucomicrobiales bacterium]|nr:hypothetical protein [Verrucomicrobiales bacterium]